MSARDEIRFENLHQQQKVYKSQIESLLKTHQATTDYKERIRIGSRIEMIYANLKLIDEKIATLSEAETAVDKVESIANDVAGNLQNLQLAEADDGSRHIKALEAQINSLVKTSTESIQLLKERSFSSGIEPRLSVLRPNVKLVDANLAYRYADLQSDVNILFGFTTLFLGTGIASVVSLGIAFSTTTEKQVIAIHSSITIFSLFVALLFGFLSLRAYSKANKAKEQFETDAGESEIILRLDKENNV